MSPDLSEACKDADRSSPTCVQHVPGFKELQKSDVPSGVSDTSVRVTAYSCPIHVTKMATKKIGPDFIAFTFKQVFPFLFLFWVGRR